MSGRFIGDNIRLIYDVLSDANTTNKRGMMLLIDFEKAFDTVAWSFLKKALRYLNFGENFIKWFEMFTNQINSRVIVNNTVSSPFCVERGVRQGDPISPYLFLIVSEILAHKIRQNINIKGYKINDMEVKITQYADDASLLLDGSQKSFEEAINTLSDFYKYSGLKMNNDQTKVIWFGCPRPPETRYMPQHPFEWNPEHFRILGIDFTADLNDITEINLQIHIESIKSTLRSWEKRNLTPFGKATVLKSLILSKIIHILTALPNPTERTISALQNIFMDFLWSKKGNKIKNSVVKQEVTQGGLAIPEIKAFTNSLKLTWLKRMTHQKQTWNTLLQTHIPNMQDIFKVGPQIAHNLKESTENKFWKDFLHAFIEFSKKKRT